MEKKKEEREEDKVGDKIWVLSVELRLKKGDKETYVIQPIFNTTLRKDILEDSVKAIEAGIKEVYK